MYFACFLTINTVICGIEFPLNKIRNIAKGIILSNLRASLIIYEGGGSFYVHPIVLSHLKLKYARSNNAYSLDCFELVTIIYGNNLFIINYLNEPSLNDTSFENIFKILHNYSEIKLVQPGNKFYPTVRETQFNNLNTINFIITVTS